MTIKKLESHLERLRKVQDWSDSPFTDETNDLIEVLARRIDKKKRPFVF